VIWSGWYSEYQSIVNSIKHASRMGWDIYSTINPIRIPATNRDLVPFKRTAKDADVTEIKTIFFDFDPERETGTASTEEQILLCQTQAMAAADYLEEDGWSAPTFGMSGNGVHLLYYTDGISKEEKPRIRALYAGMAKRFGTDDVSFDVSVKNPARIARVLGTTNHKAGRKSYCAYSEQETQGDVILKTADKVTPPKKERHWVKPTKPEGENNGYLDGPALFSRMQSRIIEEVEPGKYWVECPNMHQHGHTGKTDSVMWFDGKYITYKCSHAHCQNIEAKELDRMV